MDRSSTTPDDLYLNRRAIRRVTFRHAIRFVLNPDRPLRLEKGLTQDVSLRGIQILSTTVPEQKKSFDLWIPLDGDDVIHAKARTAWIEIEDSLGDSPYWIRTGLELTFSNLKERKLLAEALFHKTRSDRVRLEEATSKTAYIF